MLIIRAEVDLIIIDLEEAFGKIIRFSALDASKIPSKEHPDRILVISPEESDIFLTYIDKIISDISPHVIPHLDRETWEEISDLVGEEEIDEELQNNQVIVASFTKEVMTKEGLKLVGEALDRALTEGVLSQWEEGYEAYAYLQQVHERNYQDAVRQITNAVTYRVQRKHRLRITPRTL